MKKSVSVPENKKPQEQQTAVKKPRRSRCRHVFKLLSLSLCALMPHMARLCAFIFPLSITVTESDFVLCSFSSAEKLPFASKSP